MKIFLPATANSLSFPMPSVKNATFKKNHATNSFELQDFICELLCEFANFLQIFSIDNLKMLIYLPRFDLEISKLKKPILMTNPNHTTYLSCI